MTDHNIRLGDDWTVTTDDDEMADRRRRDGYVVVSTGGESR